MRAVQFDEYGDPTVLHVAEGVAEPHAGPGQVRIKVRATAVNPYDAQVRAGAFGGDMFPVIPGNDAAGVVDEVGPGAQATVGDLVFGSGSGVTAQYAVLHSFAPVPGSVPVEETAALPTVVETAARSLDLLGLRPDDLVVLDGAAGGVGSAAVQLAVARGLRVIGTASERNHTYLRALGATPTTYGAGLLERVRGLLAGEVTGPVVGAVDLQGKGAVPDLVELTEDPAKVVTIADFEAGELGVQVTGGSGGTRAWYALAEAAELLETGGLAPQVTQSLPWDAAPRAHALIEDGHVRGKIVLTVPEG